MSSHSPPIRASVSLRRLFPASSFVGCADIHAFDVSECSRTCPPGAVFAALEGTRCSGTRHVAEAVRRGASAVLVDRPLPDVQVPQCVVSNVRLAYARLCDATAGYPARHLSLTGVTGTNGKSTVAWLLRSILREAGHQTGLLGTIEYDDGRSTEAASLTTPDARLLAGWMQRMRSAGTTHAAIELSSHALAQQRAGAVRLAAAVLTNVTQDHYDYHGTAREYRRAKAAVFDHCSPDVPVVVNLDDPGSRRLLDETPGHGPIITCSLNGPADCTATIREATLEGTTFDLKLPQADSSRVTTSLIGRHNVLNCLQAAAAAWHQGVPIPQIVRGIAEVERIPGRLDRIECGSGAAVLIDYAHTDDALGRCLEFLRELTPGRLICVFGAGGDRDRTKRPLLAQAASLADLAVITNDNPRTEPPAQIITDLLQGFSRDRQPARIELDRHRAIAWALDQAGPGDCVLIAGKGHEVCQIIGSERIPFSDHEAVRQWRRDDAHSTIPAPVFRLPTATRRSA